MTQSESIAVYVIDWTPLDRGDPNLKPGRTCRLKTTGRVAAALARQMDERYPDYIHQPRRLKPEETPC